MSFRSILPLGLLLALAASASAAGPPVAEGNWKLAVLNGPTAEITYALLKVELKDGKPVGSLIAAHPALKDLTLESFSVDGNTVRAVLKMPQGPETFEGVVSSKDGRKILGSFGNDTRLTPATLEATDATKVEAKDAFRQVEQPAPLQKMQTLTNRIAQLRLKLRQEKDANGKAAIEKDLAEAEKEAQTEIPKLLQEALDKHSDSPALFSAALAQLRVAARNKISPEQAENWAAALVKAAEPYGSRWQKDIDLQVAEALVGQPGYTEMAERYVGRIEKALGEQDPVARQVRVLKALTLAQRKAGKTDLSRIEEKLAKLEEILDKEYLTKNPPLKADTYGGRAAKSQRVVVMELFTGAQCPPCVAADVAFDALGRTYKAADVVLLQYHLHIPGPDPLTNGDTEKRADFYKVHSTPNTLFNGKAQAGGGGPASAGGAKYLQYRQILDPLLETPEAATVTATVSRHGNKLEIKATVSGLKEPGADKKLRLVLVEEVIRYTGGNGLRFHHHVVRAFPGGTEGFALKEEKTEQTASIDLDELRKQLDQYLDDYAANKRPFPQMDRPLQLKHLHVIALVQDDKTNEILQAAQVEVADEK